VRAERLDGTEESRKIDVVMVWIYETNSARTLFAACGFHFRAYVLRRLVDQADESVQHTRREAWCGPSERSQCGGRDMRRL